MLRLCAAAVTSTVDFLRSDPPEQSLRPGPAPGRGPLRDPITLLNYEILLVCLLRQCPLQAGSALLSHEMQSIDFWNAVAARVDAIKFRIDRCCVSLHPSEDIAALNFITYSRGKIKKKCCKPDARVEPDRAKCFSWSITSHYPLLSDISDEIYIAPRALRVSGGRRGEPLAAAAAQPTAPGDGAGDHDSDRVQSPLTAPERRCQKGKLHPFFKSRGQKGSFFRHPEAPLSLAAN